MEALDIPRSWAFIGYLCVGFPREEHLIPELERAGWEQRQKLAAGAQHRAGAFGDGGQVAGALLLVDPAEIVADGGAVRLARRDRVLREGGHGCA